MKTWKRNLATALAGLACVAAALPAVAQQAGTQFIGITGYRVGPYGANGA